MIRRFLRRNQMYDNTTRIHARREIELLICNGILAVIVASSELEEESVEEEFVEESNVGVADEAVGVRVLIKASVSDGEAEELPVDAEDKVDVKSPPGDLPGLPGRAAMILKGWMQSFLSK
jgi:hypothetical protein